MPPDIPWIRDAPSGATAYFRPYTDADRAAVQQALEGREYEACVRALLRHGLTIDQALALPKPDVYEMARYLARSNRLAQADRKLMFEVRSPEHLPFTRWSYVRAVVLLALTVIVVVAFCGLFGGIFL